MSAARFTADGRPHPTMLHSLPSLILATLEVSVRRSVVSELIVITVKNNPHLEKTWLQQIFMFQCFPIGSQPEERRQIRRLSRNTTHTLKTVVLSRD